MAGEQVFGVAAVWGRVEDVPLRLDDVGVTLGAEFVIFSNDHATAQSEPCIPEEPHDPAQKIIIVGL